MTDVFVSSPKKEKREPRSKWHPLSAYMIYPDQGIRFENQTDREEIVLLLRAHPVTAFPWIILGVVMLFVPFLFFLSGSFFQIKLSLIPYSYQIIGFLLWYLLTFAYVFQSFLLWYFNIYIVTQERIVDFDFYALLYKEISDAPIDKIQDVTYKMGGPFPTIFNFGNVFIQTAAKVPQFEFLNVPKPDEVAKTITELMGKQTAK